MVSFMNRITMGTSLKYMDQEEFIYDCPTKSVLVFDVDCQGLAEYTSIGAKLMIEFPQVFRVYKQMCLLGKIYAGQMIPLEERGRKIVLLFTTNFKVGKNKDEEETIIKFTKDAIEKMTNILGTDQQYCSTIMCRHVKAWQKISPWIGEQKYNWSVYRK